MRRGLAMLRRPLLPLCLPPAILRSTTWSTKARRQVGWKCCRSATATAGASNGHRPARAAWGASRPADRCALKRGSPPAAKRATRWPAPAPNSVRQPAARTSNGGGGFGAAVGSNFPTSWKRTSGTWAYINRPPARARTRLSAFSDSGILWSTAPGMTLTFPTRRCR